MNGPTFRDELVPAVEAKRLILEGIEPVGVERINLSAARNRILAEPLSAKRTQPPFDASAMDGYGVQQRDLDTLPVSLNVIGESAAGRPYKGSVGAGQAVRIFTGGVVPEGADTIIIQENTVRQGNRVEVLAGNAPGKFIRPAGMDFRTGEQLLEPGMVLDAARLSLAASMNHARVPVYAKPAVAIMATGDELVLPGEKLEEGQIIASNSFGLGALVEASGGRVHDLGIAGDTKQSLHGLIEQALDLDVDLIVTMGGASVGDHDLVKPAMEDFGFVFAFHKIAMRPGKPLLFALKERDHKTVRMIGLAGNPVSSLIAGTVFVRPLLQSLAGCDPEVLTPLNAVLGVDLPENDEREEYMRAVGRRLADGSLQVSPFAKQDSSMLANLVRANYLVIREKHAPAAKAGDPCLALPL